MNNNLYKFDIPKHLKSIIKVIGVGGGGTNAINHMYNQGIKDVEFIVCNTDAQSLNASPIPNKLQLGINLTDGLGAGANPEVGRNAAIESKEDIREMLCNDTKMVFITAGMGGGTGTGAAPVIAKVAKELEILTVGIITAPFAFEGKKKMKQAEEGILELKANCDTVLVILNDNLREIYGNLSITEAFAKADNVLLTAAKGIAEIITVPGHVNVDFEDVKTTMRNSGAAIMGSSQTEGENRALKAAEEAISSPLLDSKDIQGAEKILLSIISGDEAELQMDELSEITNFIQEKAGDDAQVIFGHGNDPGLGQAIRVTVIATGFSHKPLGSDADMRRVIDLETNKQIQIFNKEEPKEVDQPVKEADNYLSNAFIEPKKTNTDKINYGFVGGSFEMSSHNDDENIEEQEQIEHENHSKEEKDDNEVPIRHNLESQIELEVSNQLESKGFNAKEVEPNDHEFLSKRERLMMESRQRSMELKTSHKDMINAENFKSFLEVPAYERKKVRLQNVPHSSEKNISRFNLDDEFNISKNNPYLHDRPD